MHDGTQGNGQGEGSSAWPTAIGSFAILALVASVVSLGAAIHKSDSSVTVAAASTTAASATPFDFGASPPDDFVARDPKAPAPSTAPAGTVHKLTFDMIEKPIPIAPGVSQLMWTFNGQVPGPIVRGKVGDTFEITLVNKGKVAHSADLHASKVSPDRTMRLVQPGKSFVYRFTAEHSGIFMYHCGAPPVLEHLGMGMYGAIIIDPPGLAPAAHEYVMVQSELYRSSDPAQPVDYQKLVDENWDAVVFNGYVGQYTARPIHVGVNQKVRVWVIDDGPSDISSFHVIGTIFDTVYKEGAYRLRPDASNGGGQALDLTPAQGGFVEFTLSVPGRYPFVTHKFSDATKGANGLFVAS